MVKKSPMHYTIGNIEVWDFIRDQGMNYHRGNAIKYICRAGYKSTGTEIEDLKKAIHYLENEVTHLSSLPNAVIGGSSNRVPDSVWDEKWDWESDYATGFDR